MKRAALILAVLLVACSIRRPAPPSPVTLPPVFAGTGGGSPLPARWWETFADPGLDACIERALAGNPGLAAARDRLAQAQAVAHRQAAADWPSLDLSADARRSRSRDLPAPPPLHQHQADMTEAVVVGGAAGAEDAAAAEKARHPEPTYLTANRYGLGLTARYELDLWGRVAALEDAAQLDTEAGEFDLRTAAITLSAEVARAWYALAAARETAVLLRAQLATHERRETILTGRARLGRALATDAYRQRQQVAAVRALLTAAEADAGVQERRLAVLAGLPPTAAPPADPRLVDPPPPPATGLPATLVAARPDLERAWRVVLAADRRAAAAAADRLPRISLTASAGTEAPKVRELFDDWVATLAGNLLGPLFDGGARAAEYHRSRAVFDERLNLYAQAVLAALVEVEDALAAEAAQRTVLTELDAQLAAGGVIVERTAARHRLGQGDYLVHLEALTAQQGLTRARLTARLALLERRIALCRALAGGWPDAGGRRGGTP
jgi:outer membrane protein TolC